MERFVGRRAVLVGLAAALSPSPAFAQKPATLQSLLLLADRVIQ